MADEKNPGGRPPHFENEADLKKKVEDYFIWVKGEKQTIVLASGETVEQVREPEPVTVTGLALFLGFESRQSIYDYGESDKFSYIIKNARLRVECEYEKKLSANNPTGSIFALKNMGWKDRQEIAPVDQDGNALQPIININVVQPIKPPDEAKEWLGNKESH